MSDITFDITSDGSQTTPDQGGSDVSVDISGAGGETQVADPVQTQVVDPAQTQVADPAQKESAPQEQQKTKLDIEGLKSMTSRMSNNQEAESSQKTDGSESSANTIEYSDGTKARIRELHNGVTGEYGATNAKPAKKEKDQYINESGLAITPEQYEKALQDNIVLAKFIGEVDSKLEEGRQLKSINSALEEKLRIQSSIPEDLTDFVSVLQKSRGGDEDASWQALEMMGDEFDKILPGMGGKFIQFLNSFSSTQSSTSTSKSAPKALSQKQLIDKALEGMFDI